MGQGRGGHSQWTKPNSVSPNRAAYPREDFRIVPRLTHLDLSTFAGQPRPGVGHVGLEVLFAAFARVLSMTKTLLPYSTIVRRLVLNGFSNHLTDELFAHVSICRNLERLTIPSAVNLTSRSLKNVFGKLHELVAIDLSGVEAVDDAVLHVIINNCPPLQGLSLCQCPKITDEGILAVASKLQGLRRIKLDDCKSLTDRSIVALTRGCPLLMEFALARMPQLSNDTTTAIFFNLRALRDLRMPDNELISAIPHLFSFAWLNETQVLKAVGAYPWYLTGTPRPKAMARQCPRPPNLDMALVRPVTTSFDHLRVVDFNSCKGLNDQAVDNLIDNARQLRSITLTKCVKLTDATVENCSLLTDVSVVALASNLPKLRRVGLVKVTNITDKGIQALAERYSTMERLHLSYCDKVSVKTVAFLLNRLPLLTHLSVTGISVFRTAELQQFSREPPDSFNLHQRETFCVYSGQGVAALRSYLNSQMTESASEGSSTRRGSESSTSSSAPVAYRGGLDELAVTFQAATPGWEQSSSRALDSVVDVAGNQSSEAGASEPRSAGGAPLNPDLSFLSLSEAASHPDNTGSTRGRPTRSESTRLV
ncbi:SCF ubiquitin ligase complex subunit [Apiotrichum porosum]|uniref:SCF ubiquitin ligase complex subunit n=1 Tax=Apiotrichum porosum TaxID=105984 RepID=A0A427Y0N9_9TREE|nr:SCF ubiquitin ligase complex subunit [Apiotrichum porosum]RSH84669.1 SCF ubiquitin ligase complex subunit [Apiotrichum porosum]